MTQVMQEVLDLLDLEAIEANLFRGSSLNIVGKNVFGGQVLAQALMAAGRTTDGRLANSMHGYFLRAGDTTAPIVYQADRVRDGKSFSTRMVKAIQHGETIFIMSASFAVMEEGLEHQAEMPVVDGPDGILSETELRQNHEAAANKAKYIWSKSNPATHQEDHSYLVKKRIQPLGVRISRQSLESIEG